MLLSLPSFHFYTLPFSSFLTHTLYPMSFLTTLISSFPILSYSSHHITLSSSHFHSHLISSHHTSHHHSHCLLSHTIHLFILTTFHAFAHHLICITLITSHIHLSFIPHHPHSIILPFHHSLIFHFSTHIFHHGALTDSTKTHFLPFHLSYPPIHSFTIHSSHFHLHHLHHQTSLLLISILIIVLLSYISLPLLRLPRHSLFKHTLSSPLPFHLLHSIPYHHSHSFPTLLLLLSLTCSVVPSLFIIKPSSYSHSFFRISFIPYCHSLYSME